MKLGRGTTGLRITYLDVCFRIQKAWLNVVCTVFIGMYHFWLFMYFSKS